MSDPVPCYMKDNSAGDIFISQYNASTEGQGTGNLGAAGALALAKQGKTYREILDYFYSNSISFPCLIYFLYINL